MLLELAGRKSMCVIKAEEKLPALAPKQVESVGTKKKKNNVSVCTYATGRQ